MSTESAWRKVLRDAGYRLIEVPYRMGEENPEYVFDDTPTTASMIDRTLGMGLAPPRIKP